MRAKRFTDEEAARAFDEALHDHDVRPSAADADDHGAEGGVYPYETAAGTRWRYVRPALGWQADEQARVHEPEGGARRPGAGVVEQIDRGELRHTEQTFGSWWETLAAQTQAISRAERLAGV